MNRKQLILLVVIGAVVALAWFFTHQKEQDVYRESSQRMGQQLLPDLAVNDVTALCFKQGKAELNLVKKDDVWAVKERGDYPANFGNLRELLIKFSDMKITKPVTSPRLAQLELLPPDKSPSTLVEFKDAKGKSMKSLLLGAKHNREARENSPYGGGAWPDGRYVMVDNDAKKVALINDVLSNTDPKPEEWLNKEWFKVEKLRSIAITSTNATNNWKLSRDSETNEWKLAELKPGEQLDSSKLSQVTSALSSPSFNDLATNSAPDKTGMDKPLLAKLETVDGFTYDIKVGNKIGDNDYYLKAAVSGAFAKERIPGKDEKPEDKAKLDKEFKDKQAKLEEKLKTEKNFEKWTYVVSKWNIEPLLKERKDLLQEKKEEPKAADATPKPAADVKPADLPKLPEAPKPAAASKPVEVKPAAAKIARTNKIDVPMPPMPPAPPEPEKK